MGENAHTDIASVDPVTGVVRWHEGSTGSSPYIRRVHRDGETVVFHARGWSTGSAPNRVYVPTQYHVFEVLAESSEHVLTLRHLISFPAVMPRVSGRADSGLAVTTRPYPDPARAPTNGHHPSTAADELSQGETNRN